MLLITWQQNHKNNYFELDLTDITVMRQGYRILSIFSHESFKSNLNRQDNVTSSQTQDCGNYTQEFKNPLTPLW